MSEQILIPNHVNIHAKILTSQSTLPNDLPGVHPDDSVTDGKVLLPKGVVVNQMIVASASAPSPELTVLRPTQEDVSTLGVVPEDSPTKPYDALFQIAEPWDFLKHTAQSAGLKGWEPVFDGLKFVEGKSRVKDLLAKSASYLRTHSTQVNRVLEFLPKDSADPLKTWIVLSTCLLSDRAEDVSESITVLSQIPADKAVRWLEWMNTSTDPEVKKRVVELSGKLLDALPIPKIPYDEQTLDTLLVHMDINDPVQRTVVDLLRLNPAVFTQNNQNTINTVAKKYIRYINKHMQVAEPLNSNKNLNVVISEQDIESVGEAAFREAMFWISRSEGVSNGDTKDFTLRQAKKFHSYEYVSDKKKPEFTFPADSTFDIGKTLAASSEKQNKLVSDEFISFIESIGSVCQDNPEFVGPIFHRLNLVLDSYRYSQEISQISQSEPIVDVILSMISGIDPRYLQSDTVWNFLNKLEPSQQQSLEILQRMDVSGRLDHLLARTLLISVPPESKFVLEQVSRVHQLKQLCEGDISLILKEWSRIQTLAKRIISINTPNPNVEKAGNLGMDLEFIPHVVGPRVPDGFEVGRDTSINSPFEARVQKDPNILLYNKRWQQRGIRLIEWLQLTKSDPISVHLHVDAPASIDMKLPLYRLILGNSYNDVKNDALGKLSSRGTIEIRSALSSYGAKDKEGIGFDNLNFFPLADFLLIFQKSELSLSMARDQLHEEFFLDRDMARFFSVCSVTTDPEARAAAAILLTGIWGKRLADRDPDFYRRIFRANEPGFVQELLTEYSNVTKVVASLEDIVPFLQSSTVVNEYIDMLKNSMLDEQKSSELSLEALSFGLRLIGKSDSFSKDLHLSQKFYRDLLLLGLVKDANFIKTVTEDIHVMADSVLEHILQAQNSILDHYSTDIPAQLTIRKQYAQLQEKIFTSGSVRLPDYAHRKFNLPTETTDVSIGFEKYLYKNPNASKEQQFWETVLSTTDSHPDLVLATHMLLISTSSAAKQMALLPGWVEKINEYYTKHPKEDFNRGKIRIIVYTILNDILSRVKSPDEYTKSLHSSLLSIFNSGMSIDLLNHLDNYDEITKYALSDKQRLLWAKGFVYKGKVDWEGNTGTILYFNKLFTRVMSLKIPLSEKKKFFGYCLTSFQASKQKKFSWNFSNDELYNSAILFINEHVPSFKFTSEDKRKLAELRKQSLDVVPQSAKIEQKEYNYDVELHDLSRVGSQWKKVS